MDFHGWYVRAHARAPGQAPVKLHSSCRWTGIATTARGVAPRELSTIIAPGIERICLRLDYVSLGVATMFHVCSLGKSLRRRRARVEAQVPPPSRFASHRMPSC